MKLELKLALIGALSRIIIFALFLIALELIFNQIASRHTDRDLVKMKDKTMAIINRVGIRSFLKEEQDSAYASYNLLKEEFITLNLTPDTAVASQSFSSVSREIEGEEFDYRILTYNFNSGRQYYMLEIGRNVQLISSFKQAIKMISVVTILIVLLITILIDLGIYEALLRPLNNVIIPKLRKTTSPETFEYSELKTSTTDFAYLNKVINDLMHKVSDSMATQKRFIADVSPCIKNPDRPNMLLPE